MDAEGQRKFDSELSWCLEQLRLGLESGGQSEKRSQEAVKVMQSLQSPKVSLVKKRLLMRNSFGDYRVKMEAEEKRFKLAAKVDRHSAPPKDSKFLKRSLQTSTVAAASSGFRFNFSEDVAPVIVSAGVEEEEKPAEVVGDGKTGCDETQSVENSVASERCHSSFKFVPSPNSFKFNFQNTNQ